MYCVLNTGWDCSAWVRTYALFLEERLECFRTLKNDIVAERSTKTSAGINKVHFVHILFSFKIHNENNVHNLSSHQVHCRTRLLNGEELLEQLPALQQLLYRLTGCQVVTTFAIN